MRDKSRYDQNYMKINCKQYKLLLHKEKDKDLIAYLETITNRNGYLKSLIREEMKKGQ